MLDQGITIEVQGDVVYLSGDMNENADLMPLLNCPEPLIINLSKVRRFNSTGIRNLLKFLQKWGSRQLSYQECPCDFIDQVNMIPSLLGQGSPGYSIVSLSMPYECRNCNYEDEIIENIETVKAVVGEDNQSTKKLCPQCASPLFLISEAYLVFLTR
jgi:hypothetical protein